jgi:hypothetical protein
VRRLDAFLVGANLPWVRYGGDFGANAWSPGGGVAEIGSRARAHDLLAALADAGARVVRWFLLCDGRAGLKFDDTGTVRGLDDRVFPDLDAAIDLLRRTGLTAIFVVLDFTWFAAARTVDRVRTGGRTGVVADEGRRAQLLEHALAPILGHCGGVEEILAWDVLNEPDWIVSRLPRPRRRITLETLRALVREVSCLVHECTAHLATVGTARPAMLRRLAGLGLDFYQVHWYDKVSCRFPLERHVSALEADRPVVLGEFPTRGCPRSVRSMMEVARKSGYAGALAWSVASEDHASDRAALEAGIRSLG